MSGKVYYWDANAFLGLINNEPEKTTVALPVWEDRTKGLVTIVTSALTIAEVIHAKSAGKVDPSKRHVVNNFFRQPNLVIELLTRKIAELARDVVWDHSVKPKDACHIATAAFLKIATIHTFDEPMILKSSISIEGFEVLISKPRAEAQQIELPVTVPQITSPEAPQIKVEKKNEPTKAFTEGKTIKAAKSGMPDARNTKRVKKPKA
jgi:predicted nucleic acid-binding protein